MKRLSHKLLLCLFAITTNTTIMAVSHSDISLKFIGMPPFILQNISVELEKPLHQHLKPCAKSIINKQKAQQNNQIFFTKVNKGCEHYRTAVTVKITSTSGLDSLITISHTAHDGRPNVYFNSFNNNPMHGLHFNTKRGGEAYKIPLPNKPHVVTLYYTPLAN